MKLRLGWVSIQPHLTVTISDLITGDLRLYRTASDIRQQLLIRLLQIMNSSVYLLIKLSVSLLNSLIDDRQPVYYHQQLLITSSANSRTLLLHHHVSFLHDIILTLYGALPFSKIESLHPSLGQHKISQNQSKSIGCPKYTQTWNFKPTSNREKKSHNFEMPAPRLISSQRPEDHPLKKKIT